MTGKFPDEGNGSIFFTILKIMRIFNPCLILRLLSPNHFCFLKISSLMFTVHLLLFRCYFILFLLPRFLFFPLFCISCPPSKLFFSKMQWEEAKNDMENEVVKRLAKKYNKTPAQICLRYLIERDICVIPKSVKENRVKENFDVNFFAIDFPPVARSLQCLIF